MGVILKVWKVWKHNLLWKNVNTTSNLNHYTIRIWITGIFKWNYWIGKIKCLLFKCLMFEWHLNSKLIIRYSDAQLQSAIQMVIWIVNKIDWYKYRCHLLNGTFNNLPGFNHFNTEWVLYSYQLLKEWSGRSLIKLNLLSITWKQLKSLQP